MYKPLPIAATTLIYPFLYGSTWLRVPTALCTYVTAQLALDDWTYFRIRQGEKTEVLKVVGTLAPNVLIVKRALDYTCEYSFLAGAVLEYVDTVAGLLDSYVSPALLLAGLGVIQIDGPRISYPDIKITQKGAGQLVGGGAKLEVGRIDNLYGCCSPNNAPAPL